MGQIAWVGASTDLNSDLLVAAYFGGDDKPAEAF